MNREQYMRGYMDPGDTSGRPTYSPTPEQQAYSPGRDALSAYLQWRAEQTTPDPTITDEGKLQYDPNDTRLAELGMGAAGPLGIGRIIKRVAPSGYVDLVSMRGGPEREMGSLNFLRSRFEGVMPPRFGSIQSSHPRATAELLQALEQDLGPELNNMQLSDIMRPAAPFWGSVMKRKRMDAYPDLKSRVMEQLDELSKNTKKPFDELWPD